MSTPSSLANFRTLGVADDIFKALFWETNPVPIKYAVNKSGFNVGSTRLPMYEPSPEFKEKFDPIFKKYKIDLNN